MSLNPNSSYPLTPPGRRQAVLTETIRVSTDPDTEEILALLDDAYARDILHETQTEALSAKAISDACDISVSTVYRRAERLVDAGLLAERRIAQPDGNHYSMYEARLDELTVRLTDDGFEIAVVEKPTGDLADRFTELWEGL